MNSLQRDAMNSDFDHLEEQGEAHSRQEQRISFVGSDNNKPEEYDQKVIEAAIDAAGDHEDQGSEPDVVEFTDDPLEGSEPMDNDLVGSAEGNSEVKITHVEEQEPKKPKKLQHYGGLDLESRPSITESQRSGGSKKKKEVLMRKYSAPGKSKMNLNLSNYKSLNSSKKSESFAVINLIPDSDGSKAQRRIQSFGHQRAVNASNSFHKSTTKPTGSTLYKSLANSNIILPKAVAKPNNFKKKVGSPRAPNLATAKLKKKSLSTTQSLTNLHPQLQKTLMKTEDPQMRKLNENQSIYQQTIQKMKLQLQPKTTTSAQSASFQNKFSRKPKAKGPTAKQPDEETKQRDIINGEAELMRPKRKTGNENAVPASSANPQQPSSAIGLLRGSSLSGKLSGLQTVTKTAEDEQSCMPPFPLSAEDAIKWFGQYLNDFEKIEISSYSHEIYYLGENCRKKIKGHLIKQGPPEATQRHKARLKQMGIFNHGFDDEQGDYQVVLKDHLGYRYEVLEFLGQGSFGQAIKCFDHKTKEMVALKLIRNKKKFQYQAGIELKILKYLNHHDKYDQNNIIRINDYLLFRKHLMISFECLSINLYEFIKNNNFQGVSQSLIRRFAIQILQALKYQKDHKIVHCDLKPENILLKQQNKSGIKIIDYGSSCFLGSRIYTYIQSRFYRAPEIILGIPYTSAIDMWSFGCIVAELYSGFPLFPGENEIDQLAYIMEICGEPPINVLELSSRRQFFFDNDNRPIMVPNSRGKQRLPGSKSLESVLKCTDPKFIDFLKKCLTWHPFDRMTPLQALQHEWILEGLPETVLQHHRKMFNTPEDIHSLQQATLTDIQGFPSNAQAQSIYEIVEEIKNDDLERSIKHQQQKLLKMNRAAGSAGGSAAGIAAAAAVPVLDLKNQASALPPKIPTFEEHSPFRRQISLQESLPPPVVVPDSANISCFPDSLAPDLVSSSDENSPTAVQHTDVKIESGEAQYRVETDSLQSWQGGVSKSVNESIAKPLLSEAQVVVTEEDDEEDTLEEDIGDFSVGQERMKMQSQIKGQMEMELRAAGRLLVEKRRQELRRNQLVYIQELEEDPNLEIDDEDEDMDVSESPGHNYSIPYKTNRIPQNIQGRFMPQTDASPTRQAANPMYSNPVTFKASISPSFLHGGRATTRPLRPSQPQAQSFVQTLTKKLIGMR